VDANVDRCFRSAAEHPDQSAAELTESRSTADERFRRVVPAVTEPSRSAGIRSLLLGCRYNVSIRTTGLDGREGACPLIC